MNSLSAIAAALSESTYNLQPGQWLHIPLDERHEVRLLSVSREPGLMAVVAQRPVPRTTAHADAVESLLLGLSAETRWTEGLSGGIDEDGWNCIAFTLRETGDAKQVEAGLGRALSRLQALMVAASIRAPSMNATKRQFSWEFV
ncbi:hypothetical protein [Ottowia thiooxydans]|uniref:hypothetical protein n=1 Tax=Ottowia thiooxydans TaxID=219182 RepID=UPI0003F5EF14|nr:hypothetical protein [Ottowia thiooxydans]